MTSGLPVRRQKLAICINLGDQTEQYVIFVASDVRNIVDGLKLLRPTWRFVQLSHLMPNMTELTNGHDQHIFNRLPIEYKIEATKILMAEIELLSRAHSVVCTFSSNICRLVQILRSQKPETVRSIDEIWTPF